MKKRAVALGFFDGVHIGHGALLTRCKEVAEKKGLSPCAMTYSRHPSEILGKNPTKLLSTQDERVKLIRDLYGIEEVIIKDFTKEYAALSPVEFVERILVDELNTGYVVVGFDFRFARNGEGDAKELLRICKDKNIGCDIVDEVKIDGETVSSSLIRSLITAGDIKKATRLLGHNHCIISEVIHGQKLGQKLSFPTINQEFAKNAELPKLGVYVSRVEVLGRTYRGITNIGVRPTVGSGERALAETHILGFSGDVYGKIAKVELCEFVREEKKFDSLEKLQEQIKKDIAFAEKCWGE